MTIEDMTIEERIACVFDKIINHQSANERVGDWVISNLNSPVLIDLMYKNDAVYGFNFGTFKDYLKFYNYHREALNGTGTESLIQLESSFSSLAKKLGQKVVLLFDIFSQADTKAWLEKNGYLLNESGIYQKEFS